jgi:hypothetical protein
MPTRLQQYNMSSSSTYAFQVMWYDQLDGWNGWVEDNWQEQGNTYYKYIPFSKFFLKKWKEGSTFERKVPKSLSSFLNWGGENNTKLWPHQRHTRMDKTPVYATLTTYTVCTTKNSNPKNAIRKPHGWPSCWFWPSLRVPRSPQKGLV